eukprot:10536286-Alexandrium_andersonii.AAC.1
MAARRAAGARGARWRWSVVAVELRALVRAEAELVRAHVAAEVELVRALYVAADVESELARALHVAAE